MDLDDARAPRPGPCRAGRTRTSSSQVSPAIAFDVTDPATGRDGSARRDRRLRAQGEHRARPAAARRRASACCPHTSTAAEVLAPDIAGVVLSPGPGDPARLAGPVALARAVIDDGRPLLGICLGHQIVGRAAGAETRRLRFGHHGANHPVRDSTTGLVQVTAQNHEVQVDRRVAARRRAGSAVSQVNLNDGSVEGLRHRDLPIETVQYHPEGAPGPLDALAVFDRFVAAPRASRSARGRRARPRRAVGHPRPDAAKPASVLIIGSGPVVIGQAAEFDYAGTQACRALRAEGVRTILVNSNPATIMTDPTVADAVYLEPLTVEAVEAVIARERPEGLLAGLGGQTGAQPRDGAGPGRRVRALRRPAARDAARGDRDGRGPRGVPRPARPDRPALRAVRDRRGRDASRPRAAAPMRPSRRSACRRSSGRRSRSAAPAAGSSRPRPAYRERVRAGLRASPIGQVMVEKLPRRLAGDRVRGDARRRRHVHRGLLDGERRPARRPHRRLDRRRPGPDAARRGPPAAAQRGPGDHPRRSASRAAATSSSRSRPTRREYAVIEVNPRVSRDRPRWRRKATGYPIARVAAQIAVGRRLAEIPNVVTGTTVAAFEPALDYVVVKLPRFPFDKFPPRRPDARQPDEGDRRGDGDRPDLRGGAQQGAARPRAGRRRAAGRGPGLDADARLPRGGPRRRSGRGRRGGRGDADPLDRRARRGLRDHPLRPADAPPRSCCAASSRRRTAGCGGSSPCCAAASPRRRSSRRPGSRPWFLAEMGRNVALEARDPGGRARDRRPGRRRRPPSSWPRAKRAGFGDREIATLAGVRRRATSAAARAALGLVPGYAMVDTCAAEFAAETPYFYCDLRRRRLAARGAAGRAAGGARHRLGPGPDRAGDRVRLLRGPGGRDAPRAGLAGGHDQLEPGDGLDRLRRQLAASTSSRSTPRASASVIDAETAAGESAAPGLRPVRRPDAAQPRRRRSPPAGVPLLGSTLETIDQAEERVRFAALARPARHPPARGRHGALDRGGADARRADRLPGHRPAVASSSAASRSTSAYSPRRPRRASWPRRPSSTPTGRSGSTATSRASRSTSTPSPTARRS